MQASQTNPASLGLPANLALPQGGEEVGIDEEFLLGAQRPLDGPPGFHGVGVGVLVQLDGRGE
jgi:hypothetical protein